MVEIILDAVLRNFHGQLENVWKLGLIQFFGISCSDHFLGQAFIESYGLNSGKQDIVQLIMENSKRQELGDIRCLALEKVAESLELPCKYCSLGCPEIFPYYSKLKHEALCNFRPYNCPYAGSECPVVGDILYLVAHLRDDHKVDMHSGCTFNHRYVKSNPRDVENATWMLTVFHCFGQYFCLHFEAFQLGMAPVYMAFLRFMGDEMEARNYSYSLEVGGNGRKLTWEGTPRSVRDSHRKVRDSHDGLIIQRNMALFFSGGDRKELKLRVTGRIWKEQQNPDGVCIPNLCS
ncbi:E3 ubiquitin-protein ligase SINAT3 [Sesamum angolense]|uniref:RING-type E3 ubiquitin transferase n=1 Tax=Sesamum angolense TaxID=2727404 RepID=A0AAE1WPQ4_9LAMI|nr:E3 ubiquitin-protein ligase SINAT3 [Sesamum angolense]